MTPRSGPASRSAPGRPAGRSLQRGRCLGVRTSVTACKDDSWPPLRADASREPRLRVRVRLGVFPTGGRPVPGGAGGGGWKSSLQLWRALPHPDPDPWGRARSPSQAVGGFGAGCHAQAFVCPHLSVLSAKADPGVWAEPTLTGKLDMGVRVVGSGQVSFGADGRQVSSGHWRLWLPSTSTGSVPSSQVLGQGRLFKTPAQIHLPRPPASGLFLGVAAQSPVARSSANELAHPSGLLPPAPSMNPRAGEEGLLPPGLPSGKPSVARWMLCPRRSPFPLLSWPRGSSVLTPRCAQVAASLPGLTCGARVPAARAVLGASSLR